MKINKLDFIGILLQEGIASPSANALERLLLMHDQQLDRIAMMATEREEKEDMFAVYGLITLPRESVKYGLKTRARNYVFTASAREVIANIKVSKQLTAERISKIKDRVYCLNFDKETAAFVWKQDGDLNMIFTWSTKGSEAGGPSPGRWTGSGLGTASLNRLFELTSLFGGAGGLSEKMEQVMKDLEGLWRKVLQTLIFLELTDPEIQLVAAGKKHSDRPLGTANSSRQDVYVVDSTWNKYIIRTEGWAVKGHFRMQPCGVGRTELKLVWVTPHQKSGLTRSPQKPVEG